MTQIQIVNLTALFIASLMLSVLSGAIMNSFLMGLLPLGAFWAFTGIQIRKAYNLS